MSDCALYRYFDSEGSLLYIGIAHHPFRRLSQHKKSDRKITDVSDIKIEWYETRSDAQEAEAMAINSENPLWNKVRYKAKTQTVSEMPKHASPPCDLIMDIVRQDEFFEDCKQFFLKVGSRREVIGRMGSFFANDRLFGLCELKEAVREVCDVS